ncbi:hypothetical protein [Nannocystis bainbridge]|uniref:Uncharacterized protein n=1 Tax=Nannocystis bainbridge TaxID=2995303 RepID=A0ABT5EDA8_9BACT|nr:hypothetical protein [Nannocystis bainbridge]MDC0723540.1 hypothetical protein [Nannocystis bainbridge]
MSGRKFTDSHPSAFEPLEVLYAARGLPLPRLSFIEPEDMPQPYRQLLVHEGTMTPTLEDFFDQRLTLKVLHTSLGKDELRRQVLLVGAVDLRPAELAAIRIHLNCFESRGRELLVQGHVPLGRLLADMQVASTSRPAIFFQTWSDALMSEALAVEFRQPLFGRCNQLLEKSGRVMADVVEILPRLPEGVQGRLPGSTFVHVPRDM